MYQHIEYYFFFFFFNPGNHLTHPRQREPPMSNSSQSVNVTNPVADHLSTSQSAEQLLTLEDSQQDHDFLNDMSCRTRLAYESESLCWGAIILLLVIIDFIVWIVELANDGDGIDGVMVTTHFSLAVAILLCLEWLVRLWAIGPKKFLCSILPWIDFLASFGGLALVSYSLSILVTTQQRHTTARYFAAITLARLVRVFRIGFIIIRCGGDSFFFPQ